MKIINILILITALLLAGCASVVQAEVADAGVEANADARPHDGAVKPGYVFYHSGLPVYLGDEMENVLTVLGPETDYYTAPSCAFDGDAKIYVYGGFEIATYVTNEGGADRLYSITFFDDSVTTAEGVYIGQGFGEMTAAYGTDYEEIPGAYLYTKEGAVLSFTVEDGVITVIQYYVEDIYG